MLTCTVQLFNAEKDNERQVMPVSAQNSSCGCTEHALVQRYAKNI